MNEPARNGQPGKKLMPACFSPESTLGLKAKLICNLPAENVLSKIHPINIFWMNDATHKMNHWK